MWPEPLAVRLPLVEEVARMPRGFAAGAVAAGIKVSGRPDLGVLVCRDSASVAATFTQNRLPAAPVRLSRRHLELSEPAGGGRYGRARAVISTSGCANAATGAAGERDQRELAEALGEALGVPAESTLAVSTGLIGSRLPAGRLRQPLERLVGTRIQEADAGLAALAEQMCTTDTRSKSASVRLQLSARAGGTASVTVSGVAKGVGMLHPRMATMLALLLTDATVEPATLRRWLEPIVTRTWNQISVDGDTSTNDTVFLLASGAADERPVEEDGEAAGELRAAIEAVARSLARQQAGDGEGATTLITCQVSGGGDDEQARAVARAVVSSSLVKAAVHGRDPNWGRIAAAAGTAALRAGHSVQLEEARLRIALCGVPVFAGEPLPFDAAAVSRLMDAPEVVVRLDLGAADGTGEAFGCDLSERYVIENSAYST